MKNVWNSRYVFYLAKMKLDVVAYCTLCLYDDVLVRVHIWRLMSNVLNTQQSILSMGVSCESPSSHQNRSISNVSPDIGQPNEQTHATFLHNSYTWIIAIVCAKLHAACDDEWNITHWKRDLSTTHCVVWPSMSVVLSLRMHIVLYWKHGWHDCVLTI